MTKFREGADIFFSSRVRYDDALRVRDAKSSRFAAKPEIPEIRRGPDAVLRTLYLVGVFF